jgi:hypothetical protein
MAEPLTMSPEAQAQPAVSRPTRETTNALTQSGFRLVFLFFILGYHRFVLQYFAELAAAVLKRVPYLPDVLAPLTEYDNELNAFFFWAGGHIFHLPMVPAHPTGSGDTSLNWAEMLTYAALAVLGTAVWSFLARAKRSPEAAEILRIVIRYALGFTLLGYGLAKVIPTQFSTPTLSRLGERVGEMSPMGMLWTFMGSSTPYTIFSGVLETVAACLLLFRRTMTLGALFASVVLANIVALNLCYDVPVKVYSIFYLLSTLVLLVPDLRTLTDVLIFHRPTTPRSVAFPWPARWLRWLRPALKLLAIGGLLFLNITSSIELYRHFIASTPPPLYGIWEVEEFRRDGRIVPPLPNEAKRWRRIAINRSGGSIRFMDDSSTSVTLKNDTAHRVLQLSELPRERHWDFKDPVATPFHYEMADPSHVLLRAHAGGEEVAIRLRRLDPASSPLLNRGFHWISEMPYNR